MSLYFLIYKHYIHSGQQLVKHVISRCAVAKSPDDIFITALDAVYWTKNAWEAVKQATISNTFQATGFIYSKNQDVNDITSDDNDLNQEIINDDISTALKNLDSLLSHLHVGEQRLSANEFVEMDTDIPVFDEWNDYNDNIIIVNDEYESDKNASKNDNDEDEDVPTEQPPTIINAMEMVRQLHLLANTQQPELHLIISQLDSQLTQLFIDSKGAKQTKIDDFFRKIE